MTFRSPHNDTTPSLAYALIAAGLSIAIFAALGVGLAYLDIFLLGDS